MAHVVVCAICKIKFDTEKEQAVKHNATRYSHYSCEPDKPKCDPPKVEDVLASLSEKPPAIIQKEKEEGSDYAELTSYITSLFGKNIRWAMVGKQISSMKKQYNFSYSGMKKCLQYVYEIKKLDIQKASGVGIIPIFYNEAYQYFYDIWQAQQKNATIGNLTMTETVVTIPSPERIVKKRPRFNFLEEESES